MLSIIIPTLNEEDYLPILLESIKRQDFKDYEVIVADAGSKDKTLEIANSYKFKVVPGGLPARGRNNGAKVANGDVLFFLDADTVLSDKFLDKSIKEFELRKLDIASFCLRPYPENRFEYFLINIFYNRMIVILEKILPHSAMGIIIKKELFNKINGYDESIKLAEDHDLGRRAAKYAKFGINKFAKFGISKFAKFGIIRSVEILISTRRFKKDSWFMTGTKFFLCQLHMIFIGPVRSNIFNYKFNHYKK